MHDDVQFAVVTSIGESCATTFVTTKIVIICELEAKTCADAADANHTPTALQFCFKLFEFASQLFKRAPGRDAQRSDVSLFQLSP